MSAFVYMVRCADQTLYTGWTTNLDKRIKAHNEGTASKYTRARRPVELVYWEEFDDKVKAMQRECQIKKLSRVMKLRLCKIKNGK